MEQLAQLVLRAQLELQVPLDWMEPQAQPDLMEPLA
jgi:hypothetical protein